jgi:hypothetical protein
MYWKEALFFNWHLDFFHFNGVILQISRRREEEEKREQEMNLILLLILSLSQCVYYVNMSINRNGDGSYADNDVFESLRFVYIRKRKKW